MSASTCCSNAVFNVFASTYLLDFFLSDCNSEQDAARVLGHTQTSWDNDSGRERQPASEDKDWSQLTDRERAAALRLGFNRGMWDGLATGPQPATADMAWSELRDRERAAAAALGYSQRTWDNESGFERQPSTENKSWDELTGNEQTAAGVLGYNRRSWDGPQPDSVYKSWSELTSCGEYSPILTPLTLTPILILTLTRIFHPPILLVTIIVFIVATV